MTARVSRAQRSFSLVEVVIAVAVLAGSVTMMLALLPSLARQAAQSAEATAARGLPDAVRGELRRLAAVRGFAALAGAIPVMGVPLENGLVLVASREASSVQAIEEATLPPDAQYFQIEVWRFPKPPLAFDPAGFVLALEIRVSWPYHVPGALEPPSLAQRAQFSFATAISR